MAVTAKRWWSPKERKAASLAAKVLAYERGAKCRAVEVPFAACHCGKCWLSE